MTKRARWISGLFVLVTGALVWGAFAARRGGDPRPGATLVERPEPEPRPGDVPTSGQRTAALAQPDEPAPAAEPSPVIAGEARSIPRSPLAQDLDQVAASFLTSQPRVTDLLDLVGQMASVAVVEPASVTIQRNQEGALLSARGTLAIGDVRGTFLVDPDGYRVLIRSASEDASWSQRDIQITFEESDSDLRGCHVVVQFQPGAAESASGALLEGGERLVGWSVGTSPEKGTVARPLTLSVGEEGWNLSSSTRVPAQEFSWVADVGAFGAWLRLLKAQSGPERK